MDDALLLEDQPDDPVELLALYPFPIMSGDRKIIDTYYRLEALERGVAIYSLNKHAFEAGLWYRGLALLHDPILGTWEFADESVENGWRRKAEQVQSTIIGLEVTSAKAALDQLTRGNYSIAFAAIRHMLEAFIQIYYLFIKPQDAALWRDSGKKTPSMNNMVSLIKGVGKAVVGDGFNEEGIDRLYASWTLMSKGSHPTGGGLVQVLPDNGEGIHKLGSHYNEQLAYIGFDHGFFALTQLLSSLRMIRDPGAEWSSDVEAFDGKVGVWRVRLIEHGTLAEIMSEERIRELMVRDIKPDEAGG